MKITVITASAHADGASTYLGEQFMKGARENGADIYHYHVADHQNNFVMVDEDNGPIPQHDDLECLLQQIRQSDLLVMVTPVYYYGMSSLLKTVVDRFFDHNQELKGNKKTVLVATAADTDEKVFASLKLHYQQIIKYMDWQDAGMVLDPGRLTQPAIKMDGQRAYELGQKLSAAN